MEFCSLSFLVVVIQFFFFKQKTAYEMRISDWSSDVCSSDLLLDRRRDPTAAAALVAHPRDPDARFDIDDLPGLLVIGQDRRRTAERRSEEHTSELQSLMRTSYAVFCLKKKKNNKK